MGWQRYNRGTNAFEVSDDNGVNWVVLRISTTGLGLNVAFIDQQNTFQFNQRVWKVTPRWQMSDTGQALNQKKWDLAVFAGELYVIAMDDAEAAGTTALKMLRSGDAVFQFGIFERNRGVRMGDWTAFTPTFAANAGTVSLNTAFGCKYTFVGKTCILTFYVGVNVTASTATVIYLNLPAGIVNGGTYSAGTFGHNSVPAGIISVAPGETRLSLIRDTGAAGAFPSGGTTIAGNVSFEMA